MTPYDLTSAVATTPNPEISPITTVIMLILIIRSMIRKGIALRKAGTKKQLVWFLCIFILNTLGILPIIYLLFFQKGDKKAK